MLQDHSEVYNAQHSDAYFFSADVHNAFTNARPIVQIVYRNQTGLENYQTYHSQSVGRAGEVYTNDYNGNLVLMHQDASTPGSKLPVSVYHVYNTNNRKEDWSYGKGYRLNLSQVITNETIGDKEYARYTDEDGTKHYFEKEGNNYTDEDNIGLKLTFENDNYIIKDKDNNKLTFVRQALGEGNEYYLWHLKEIQNADGNKITLELISTRVHGAIISKVTDAAGDSITFSYSGGRLASITDSAGKSTSYIYNENGNLCRIIYPDGNQCNYSYNSNYLLTQARNANGIHVDYEYYNEKANRLKTIKEYSSKDELGNILEISYGNNVTKFMDNRGYANSYTFNNWGQTISISDFGKDRDNVDKAYGKMYKYGEGLNNKNKLTLESQLVSNNQTENNLLINADFSGVFWGWDRMGYASSQNDNVELTASGNRHFKMNCDAQGEERIYQTVEVSGKKGDIFTASAWFNTDAVPSRDNRRVGIYIRVIRNDDSEQIITIPANVEGEYWQYVSGQFITDADYKRIWFCLESNYNVNATYFDCAGLFKEEFGQSYTYDSKGNIISTQDYAKQQNSFEYDGNDNLISATNPKGGKFTYTYDTQNTKRLISATNSYGNKYSFEYDVYGNAIKTKIEESGDSATKKYIETSAEYSSDGNYQTKLIDEKGNTTQYQYNETNGTISKVTDAKGGETTYTYDNLDRISTVNKQVGQKTYSNSYIYEKDRLKSITHNGFTYTFIYDDFGNLKQTKVGNQVLSTRNYATRNGNITSETYGNNQTVSYEYDRFDRTTKVTGTNGQYEYTYDAKSNVKKIVDSINNQTETFTYDLADRLVKSINSNGFTNEYQYDINNNVSNKKYTLNANSNTVQYNYDKSNVLSNFKLNNNITWTNNYDRLLRLNSRQITSGNNSYTINYTFIDDANTANKTTTSLKSIKNGNNEEIIYTYDELGNIDTIIKGDTQTNKYYYDELNQLVREDSLEQNKSITYEYDVGGNLLNKKEYAYTTTSTIPETPIKITTYGYENTNWKDQLTSYDGKQITYDAIGNPLTYDANTYTWQNGRQLAGINNSADEIVTSYKYDESGIRTQKTVNGITTYYYLEGTKVIYEKTGNNIIYYIYDENGSIVGLKYNDTQYYYIKNGQNDIIGILDSDLNQIVSYEYDSWGNILSIKDASGDEITNSTHIGIINPYRYRSYRYDSETNLYYLQSRYYSPEWGRFLNFDNYGGQVGELLSHNGYAYCINNPVNMIDELGNSGFGIAVGFLFYNPIVAVVGIAVVVVTVAVVTVGIVGISKVSEKINDVIKEEMEHNQTVYKLVDENDNVQYVGRTKNPIARENQHKNDPKKAELEFKIIETGLTGPEARGLEQISILKYATKKEFGGLNKINGISPKNPRLIEYMIAGGKVAITYFGNTIEDEILYWIEERWR